MQSDQTIIIGNSTAININPSISTSEIRADIRVGEYSAIRLWGQILNMNQQPISNALVKLVKIIGSESCPEYLGIAHTTSDCEGFYQFDICSNENAWYKILVGKSNTGREIIIDDVNEACPNLI
ncbi:MAG: hypothetical protein RR448_00575 [Niameybacter sp.]|uniref:hypothetical protein n=1 Tax=Niameybacter sp. TaxID=2033640 RepID=UPI002FCB6E4D